MPDPRREQARTTPANPRAARALDAAQTLFGERGYGATSMDAVAAAADISKATLYAHFNSKQTLFAAMIRRECQRCMAQMALPDDVHELELESALLRIARSFLGVLAEPRVLAIFRMVVAEAARFPDLGPIFYDSGPGTTAAGVTDYLARAHRQGMICADDPALAAYQFLGMLRGDLQLRMLVGGVDVPDIEHIAQAAVTTFLRAYTPD